MQRKVARNGGAEYILERYLVIYMGRNLYGEEHPCIGKGNIDEAVELLYYFNYGNELDDPPQFNIEMRERVQEFSSFISNLLSEEIFDPGCILVDPKLLWTFHHYYPFGGADFAHMLCPGVLWDFLYIQLHSKSGLEHLIFNTPEAVPPDERIILETIRSALMTNLFHRENGRAGLYSLWLWQCQREIIFDTISDQGRHKWAQHVEIAYNLVLHLKNHRYRTNTFAILELFSIEMHKRRVLPYKYIPIYFDPFLSVYSGIRAAIKETYDRDRLAKHYLWHNGPASKDEVTKNRISIRMRMIRCEIYLFRAF